MQWDILGHETAINFLKNHTKPGKTRHAYLITGPEGVGRETLSLAFAKALNCQNPPSEGEFCGLCLACRQINEQRYPDLMTLRVTEGSKDLKIDQIREMQKMLALAPYQSRYRIVLIPDFQNATIGASNALLKSLEEPPSKALLILTADAKESLLETIASRCEVLRLRPSGIQELERYLVEDKAIEQSSAKRLAHLTAGRVGTALSLNEKPGELEAYDEALEDLANLLQSKLRDRLQYVEKRLSKKAAPREQFAFLVATWLSFWRDVMIIREGARVPLVNLKQTDLIKKTAEVIDPNQIETVLKMHERSLGLLDSYVNPRLVIENLLLQIPILG